MAHSSTSIPYFLAIFLSFHYFATAFRKDIFSTKTSYDWTYDGDKSAGLNEFMSTTLDGQTCKAAHVSVLLRHGARQPGRKDIKKMTTLHHKLKLIVTNNKYDFMNKWENYFTTEEEKNLVDAGEDEQYSLGLRFGKYFFGLFDENFNRRVQFVASNKDRTIDSAMSFYEGITESVLGEASDDLKPKINDNLLRFHEKCDRYQVSVENNRTQMQEYSKFKSSPEIKEVSRNLKNRLGIKHAEIDAGELKILYFLCAYELLAFGREDWCYLLTDEEKEVLEYHNDIKQYWKKTYGHPVISQMTCPLVKTIFTDMDKVIQNRLNSVQNRGSVGTFYFGHTETLAPVYAALGLFNDTSPLLSSNFEQMKTRQFRSSQVLQFSANLALVLYDCHDRWSNKEPEEDNFAVKMFVNEKPVTVPACSDTICWYDDVRKKYASLINNCDFDDICHIQRSKDEL